MKVRFLGAINGVTGSCTHFAYSRTNTEFLVDCGMTQGEAHSDAKNSRDFPFSPKNLKFVILTHAHIDHCGLIPKLYRDGFSGKVYCTAATARIARVALLDSLKHVDFYDESDVEGIKFEHLDKRQDFGLSRFIPLDDDLFVSFLRSAHILGSVSITLRWKVDKDTWRKMVLSGDLGNNTKENPYQSLMAPRQAPFGFPNYILTESTYGDRIREPKFKSLDDRLQQLSEVIASAFNAGESLLIPAFSLQRTQEVLFDIYHALRSNSEKFSFPIEVIVHSPLSHKFTEIFRDELCSRQEVKRDETLYRNRRMSDFLGLAGELEVDEVLKRLFPPRTPIGALARFGQLTIRYTNEEIDLAEISTKKIIVSGSGMCVGGPIVSYLDQLIENPSATILITGFMAKGTLGNSLSEYASCSHSKESLPFKSIVVNGRTIDASNIRARIFDMRSYYSGHADLEGILDFVFSGANLADSDPQVPVIVFINHGNNAAREALKMAIEAHVSAPGQRALDRVIVPYNTNDWFDLDTGQWIENENDHPILGQLLREQQRTNLLLEELLGVLRAK